MIQVRRETAVIGFSGAASPLEPAWPSTHRALLPIVGKPLIVYLIEQLADAGIKHVRIAGSLQQVAVKRRLGSGAEWGVTIRYSDLHAPDLCAQTLLEKGNVLYLVGDQMVNLTKLLELPEQKGEETDIISRYESPGYWVMTMNNYRRFTLGDSGFGEAGLLKNTRHFHEVNQMVARGDLKEVFLSGRAVKEGVYVGWDSHIHPAADIIAGVTIGDECHIGNKVRLGKGCVIGDGSIIRPGANLENVSVLPNCLVGNVVRLRNAIITPRVIFDLQGECWRVGDEDVITRARSNREEITGLPEEALSEIESINYKPEFRGYTLNKVRTINFKER